MIAFNKISKQYGKQILFVDASFQLNPGEKVGLVGPNGSGKTTLFRMIVGEEVARRRRRDDAEEADVGYFRQDIEEMAGRSVLDEVIAGSGRLGTLHHELEALQHAMADPARADEMDRILARFGEVQEEYEHLGGYALESQAREVLHGLGFDDAWIDGDVGALSGGWKMRVAMARALLGRPDVLLMDEPTNHLDIESIVWLENFLKSLPGSLLMTSHDRDFMNRIVTRVAEIDDGEITVYSGNYDFYERERALREANREAAYARQQAMLAKEQRFIDRFRRQRRQGRAGAEPRQGAREDREDRAAEEAARREVRVPPAAQIGRRRRRHRARQQALRHARRLRRLQSDRAARRALGGDGPERRRQDDAAADDRRRARAGRRPDQARREPEDGLLRAAGAAAARRGSDGVGADAEGLPARVDRRAAQPARRVSVLRRRDRQADPIAVWRRAHAARHRAHAALPAEFPRARRADQPPRSGDEGHADRGASRSSRAR